MRLPLDHLSLQLFIQTECSADAPELAQGTEESLERCAWAGLSAAKPTRAAGPSGLWWMQEVEVQCCLPLYLVQSEHLPLKAVPGRDVRLLLEASEVCVKQQDRARHQAHHEQ